MEHSLISISNWEAIWHKPYLPSIHTPGISGHKEEVSYIKCMIIGNVDEDIPNVLLNTHSSEIQDYISNPYSATRSFLVGEKPKQQLPRKTITSELIYYWMIKFGIPFTCEKWHFNKLLKLIETCNVQESQNTKAGRMSHTEAARYRHELNKQRLQAT
jgi:hypothetical protein